MVLSAYKMKFRPKENCIGGDTVSQPETLTGGVRVFLFGLLIIFTDIRNSTGIGGDTGRGTHHGTIFILCETPSHDVRVYTKTVTGVLPLF